MRTGIRTRIVAGCLMFAAGGVVFAQGSERSGSAIVNMQCANCHATGASGAPRIDDRAAWAPRMKNGLDATVRSAIKGHGAMPARGGLADLTDTELRNAILYMFYPAGEAQRKLPAAAPAAPPDPHHKSVAGMEVYLGIVVAESAPVQQQAPKGKGYYYVNISLRDSATGAPIRDATLQARASSPVSGGDSRKLEPTNFADVPGYGNFFRMQGKEPYTIAVQIRRPKAPAPAEARFEFKP